MKRLGVLLVVFLWGLTSQAQVFEGDIPQRVASGAEWEQRQILMGAGFAAAANLIGYGISEKPIVGVISGTLAAVATGYYSKIVNDGSDKGFMLSVAASVPVNLGLYLLEKKNEKLKAIKKADREYDESLLKLKTIKEERQSKY